LKLTLHSNSYDWEFVPPYAVLLRASLFGLDDRPFLSATTPGGRDHRPWRALAERGHRGVRIQQVASQHRGVCPMGIETDRTTRPRRDGAIPLGHWAGFQVDAHWSVVITVGLFIAVLAKVTLPGVSPGWSQSSYWLTAAVTSVVFLLTLLAHELAHAVVARAYGMQVKRVTLWLLGGMTELGGASPSPRAEALMAGAGPAASLVTAAVSALLALVVGPTSIVGTALVWLATVSLVLAVFNLLPGSPLDGGRLLHAFVWWRVRDRERAGLVAAASGRVIGYVLIAIGFVDVLLGLPTGLWLALVGWFVMSGASAERAAMSDQHLAGLTAGEIGRPAYPAPQWWTFDALLTRMPAGPAVSGVIPVVDLDSRVAGVVTVGDLERIPVARRSTVTLGELAARRPRPVLLDPGADLGGAIEGIRRAGGVAVVVDGDVPTAVITADDLARAIRLSLLGWHSRPPGGDEGPAGAEDQLRRPPRAS